MAVTLLTAACGSSSDQQFSSASSSGAATVVVRHSLLKGIPGPVDDIRVTGLDASGIVVYGPLQQPKQPVIELRGVPTSVVKLRLEYVDNGNVVGVNVHPLILDPGEVETVEDPVISLLEEYTTRDVSIVTASPSEKGYVRLTHGPGWPVVVRTDLGAAAQDGREGRRQALASVAQISDTHVVDSESPLRCEYLRGEQGNRFVTQQDLQGSFRAQETLTTHVVDAMVRQLNDLAVGPTTRRPYDCMISTGDNGDNRQGNETGWCISLLDGGSITPSSGNPDLYEGVQDTTSNPRFATYYHPASGVQDIYKEIYGFPDYNGLLEACVKPFQAEGSKTRWFTAYGNHDNLIMGNLPTRAKVSPTDALDKIVTGTQKNTDLPSFYQGNLLGFFIDFFNLFGFWDQFIARGDDRFRMISSQTAHRQVTADPKRRFIDPQGWAQAHFNSPPTPGPVGHGLQPDSVNTGNLYYTFPVAPGVLGITLDTVDRAGYADGSLDQAQFQWLEARLIEASSRYYNTQGTLVTNSTVPNQLIVVFSHHNSQTMNIALTDPENPEPRFKGSDLLKLFARFPNMVLWANGHSHVCRVWAHPDSSGRTGGFWELNTPSHVDFPQQSRIFEIVNNQDGTLSIFGTLVDHQAPPETSPDKLDVLGLAAISRELSANDNLIDRASQLGTPGDRNVELVIKAPF